MMALRHRKPGGRHLHAPRGQGFNRLTPHLAARFAGRQQAEDIEGGRGMRLAGKAAIVTGAGGGIGSAIAKGFAAEGAAVVCVDIDAESVSRTVSAITDSGGKAVALHADVSEEGCADAAAATAKEQFGRIDVLVCNAVYDLKLAPLTEISYSDWRRTMAVNLDSAFLLSRRAIPEMAAGGGGSIILVASQLARVARPGRPWYCAAKGGLVSLAQAMALDHANQKIRVNTLSPGPVETGRYTKNFPDVESARQSHHTLLGRLGQPDEIASGAIFLASDESSFMTGTDLLIDGGYTAV